MDCITCKNAISMVIPVKENSSSKATHQSQPLNQATLSQRALLTSNFDQSYVPPSPLNLDTYPNMYGSQSQMNHPGHPFQQQQQADTSNLYQQQADVMNDMMVEPTHRRTGSLKKRMEDLIKPTASKPALLDGSTQTEFDGAYFSNMTNEELKEILCKLIEDEDFIHMADRLEKILRSDDI